MAPPPSSPHALLVTSSGVGHINGCLLLARSLASVGFSVSFAYLSGDFHILSHKNPLPHYPSHDISFHVLEDGKAGLSSDPLAPFLATPQMHESLHKLIRRLRDEGHGVTCLVSDSFAPWTQDVADEEGIPRVEYWTSNAMSHHMVCNVGLLFDKGVFPESGHPTQWRRETPLMIEIPGFAPFLSERYPMEMRFGSKTNPFIAFFREIADKSSRGERILIHTMAELEEEAFRAYAALGKKAYAIGPLLHHAAKEGEGSAGVSHGEKREDEGKIDGGNKKEGCMAWLDGKEAGSVVYVAFGSHAKLRAEDVQELALGLEASGVPFLWALRSEVRPEGFVRTSVNAGLVIDWAPQVDVLSHPSVGGFLSHCGWNSTLESICAGVPLICCPLIAEQRSNAEFISDIWKIGLELERTPTGGLHRTMVASAVKCLMQDDVGRYIRRRVKDVTHLSKQTSREGGQSMANLQKFYEDMKAICS